MYRRRLHAPGLDLHARTRHAEIYRALRDAPPAAVRRARASTAAAPTLSPPRKLLYPVLYGERRLLNRVRFVKPLLDRAGVWTPKR